MYSKLRLECDCENYAGGFMDNCSYTLKKHYVAAGTVSTFRTMLALLVCVSVLLSTATPAFAAEIDYDAEFTEEETHGIVNILLLGVDTLGDWIDDTGRSDCIMICSLNKDTGDIGLISIERAVYVEVPGVGKDLISHAHHYGGGELVQQLVSEYFNVDLTGYCEVNFQGFINAVDALGGIDVELTEYECWGFNGDQNDIFPDNSALTMQKMYPGTNHLDGYDTLMYCRMRAIDSDWHRIERQRNAIQQLIDKAIDSSLEHIVGMVKAVMEYVETNLPASEICSLLACADKFSGTVARQLTVPVKTKPITCNFESESERIREFIYCPAELEDSGD